MAEPVTDMQLELTNYAVKEFAASGNTEAAIAYLTQNKSEVSEFCLGLSEQYTKGDLAGVIQLGQIISDLLVKLETKAD